MSSIATAVFKLTVGMLVNKGRDKAAEKLKDGDVTDQLFRDLIVREIDDIKSKLDGLTRKDLLATITFFKEGIELLYQVFDKARITSDATTCHKAFSLVKEMKKLELTGLDESATRLLSDAKERFKDARRRATDAFANEALKTADRILAMQYRVMSTILEKIDTPVDALAPCRVCVEDLHGLPAVQRYFKVELTKGLRARFEKDERRKIIAEVWHVNFFINSTSLMICFGNEEQPKLPCVIMGEDKVDPLRDERVAKVLRGQGMKHCCVTPWSFGREREVEHSWLRCPDGIATNSSGQFIVGDKDVVKMFDPTGQFIQHFSPPNDDVKTKLTILDVATDNRDNIYVLVSVFERGSVEFVYEFSNTADLHHKFPVRYGFRLKVTNSKVLVLSSSNVHVYDTDGLFVCSFGEGTLKTACDITAANDGRVMVVNWDDCCVHIFSEDGHHLDKFQLQGGLYSCSRIAFRMLSKHVVIAGKKGDHRVIFVEIFTKDGDFVRCTKIDVEPLLRIKGMTVTRDGRIALVLFYMDYTSKELKKYAQKTSGCR
ncbi:uncharacterized protein [Montipora foliosa]|uniref:uncharacterized protein isoform X2 n=1 Tax=Montipora foliosa TaxID=591990 RepID=UPI0035F20DE5